MNAPLYILGTHLPPHLQKQAIAKYVYRYTGDHKPVWANKPMPDGSPYPIQFKDDMDWLAHTYFPVRKDFTRLLNQPCESYPTWPNNPELGCNDPILPGYDSPEEIRDILKSVPPYDPARKAYLDLVREMREQPSKE